MSTPFTHDEEIRRGIEQLITTRELTHARAANLIGLSSASRLTKYLGLNKPENRPEPDMPRVEKTIRNFLRHQDRRAAATSSLFETSATKTVDDTIKQIRRTGDMGLLWGPAGSGKTSGAQLFCRNHPATILFTATKDRRDAKAVRNAVFEELRNERDAANRNYSGNTPRAEWIQRILRGTERVILVDNVQRLSLDALEWFADLNDATHTPVAFLGNPEVLNIIRKSDQLSSRIGIVTEVKISRDEGAIAKKLVEQFAPEGNGELVDCVVSVVGDIGYARRAKKTLQLTQAVHEGAPALTWEQCFEASQAKLLRPNMLAEKK